MMCKLFRFGLFRVFGDYETLEKHSWLRRNKNDGIFQYSYQGEGPRFS